MLKNKKIKYFNFKKRRQYRFVGKSRVNGFPFQNSSIAIDM